MSWLMILLAPLLLYVSYHLPSYFRRWYMLRHVPGPPGRLFLGNSLDYFVSVDKLWNVIRGYVEEYYPTFKIWSMQYSVVQIRHPDDAEVLLSSPKYISKSRLYDLVLPWFGTGLLTSTGAKWHRRRKILTPAFHFNVLKEFVNVFTQEGQRMVHDLKEAGKDGKMEFELLPLILKYTLNTICETAMGTSLEETVTFQKKYRKAIHDMGEFIVHRVIRPWLANEWVFNLSPTGRKQQKTLETIHGFSKKIIAERQQYHDSTGDAFLKEADGSTSRSKSRRRMAMLDILIAAMKEGEIDVPGIQEEVDTFMFEGHDTSGMGVMFTMLLLAEHTEIQQRAREEIDAVLEKSGGKMDINDIQQFTYLDRCIKESLRLYPSVPLISRTIPEDMQLKNHLIPRGTIIVLHIYDLHRDPNFWPDPDTFDPDRFLPERSVGRHPYSYVPFSAGQRNCIGQKFSMFELKALIGHVLHNFYLEPIDLASKIKLLPDIVLRPANPVRIRFVPR